MEPRQPKDIIVRLLGIIAIGLGLLAGFTMEQARDVAGSAGPSTREAVFAVIMVTLMFAGAALAIFGHALFRDSHD